MSSHELSEALLKHVKKWYSTHTNTDQTKCSINKKTQISYRHIVYRDCATRRVSSGKAEVN